MIVSPWFRFQDHAFARLATFAKTRGISVAEAMHRLLEAGARLLEQKQAPELQALSKKQWVVLDSLKVGRSVKEIAEQLGVSEGTVRTHIHRIRQRHDGADLLALRFQHNRNPGGGDAFPDATLHADPPGL